MMDARAARECRVSGALTPMQKALWTGQKLQPDVPLYNMTQTFRISGVLDPDRFRRAFDAVQNASDVLRAVVREHSDRTATGEPRIEIFHSATVHHSFTDLTGSADSAAAFDDILNTQLQRTFGVGEFLYDSHLVKFSESDFAWCLTMHHLIADFLSVTQIYKRTSECYASPDYRNATRSDFTSFMDWTAEQQSSRRAERANRYWERQIAASEDGTLELFGNTLSKTNPRAERLALRLGAERSEQLRQLAQREPFRGISPDLGLMNVFATLLWAYVFRHSRSDRLTVGMPMHNRSMAAFRETIGLLINVIPASQSFSPHDTFESLAERTNLATLEAAKYANFAAEQPEKHRGVDAVLNFLTGSVGEFAGMPADFTWHHSGFADAHHAMRLQIQDFRRQGEFTLYLDMNEDLLAGLERHRITDSFLRLIDACLENPATRIAEVQPLSDHEYERLVRSFNATERPLTRAASLNELLAPQWQHAAAEPALEFGGNIWTYRMLDQRVERIAASLAQAGVERGRVVAVQLNRSPDFIATILAILRLGAVYLPIDSAQPERRVDRILRNAVPTMLVTEPGSGSVRCPSFRLSDLPMETGRVPAVQDVGIDDAAYVIYTSGSTGDPKGVVISHGGIVNYVAWAAEQYVTSAGLTKPRMPFYSSPAVDLTLTSIFVPLVSGGCVVVYEAEDARNDLSIVDVFRRDDVDILKLTPAHLSLLLGLGESAERISTLILGGENLTSAAANAAIAMFPRGVEIFNEYGPTETVVGCMIHRYDPDADNGPSVPIGKPIGNLRVYGLDRHGMPVIPGATGELFIAGAALATGYLNDPELTEQAFVALPAVGESRAYRSGDLVRVGSDGTMTYIGRRDNQLKVRGYRVETGEIESRLQAFPGVTRAAVAEIERARSQAAPPQIERQSCCIQCGLPDNYPQARIDPATGVCELCRQYERHRERIDGYFQTSSELKKIVADVIDGNPGTPNAIVLASGGKDSTFALHQLVRLGLTPLVFTLDNGYLSEQALNNVRRVVSDLGLELVTGRTPHMNAIFADSLQRYCNVCNGCFKTIYTLSINLALERDIHYIFTGLSRGQLFETRLAPAMFAGKQFNVDAIERDIQAARVAYHRRPDTVNERLDVRAFADDSLFDRIKIVDFYRYWDVDLTEMLEYLQREVSWLRPSDTGRSTNCLINDAGISVHKARRGYHNYALPYSWDVRLGHKTRAQALHELNDEIESSRVRKMLDEVGYVAPQPDGESQLVGTYVGEKSIPADKLRAWLQTELPGYMVPNRLIQVDELPLSVSGKLDRRRLATLASVQRNCADDTAAGNELEVALSKIWLAALGVDRIGIHENFFDLGGTSLPALQIVAQAGQLFDVPIPLPAFFDNPTVAGLASAIEDILVEQIAELSEEDVSAELLSLQTE